MKENGKKTYLTDSEAHHIQFSFEFNKIWGDVYALEPNQSFVDEGELLFWDSQTDSTFSSTLFDILSGKGYNDERRDYDDAIDEVSKILSNMRTA